MYRHEWTVVGVFGDVAIELGRYFGEGLHDHVLWRALGRLFLARFARGV
jgi:hypothetical protein